MVFYTALNLFEAYNSSVMLKQVSEGLDPAHWRKVVLATIIPFDYFSISIGLCIASINLLVKMNKHFSKKVKAEALRIKVIFLILTISYFSRGVLYIFNQCRLLDHYFTMYFPLMIFWDVIPLSMIMGYHFVAFRSEIKERGTKSTDFEKENGLKSTDFSQQSSSESLIQSS